MGLEATFSSVSGLMAQRAGPRLCTNKTAGAEVSRPIAHPALTEGEADMHPLLPQRSHLATAAHTGVQAAQVNWEGGKCP